MPELAEQMYCHQQICIPPAFPYLLRQYAKAAIRTQPVDLLQWSTAYWRCLSLNVPPPVKPRLEYPIPRDFYGVTPGWLKALNYQLAHCNTVSFRILWDRWMGACLQKNTLVQLLCLGGFTDSTAVPWNRFVALCVGTLSSNLTETMVMICEVLSDEPEGGSARITTETFLDLYKFLAAIDASKPQTLLNLYFTDAALGILQKRKKRRKKRMTVFADTSTPSASTTTWESIAAEEEQQKMVAPGEDRVVSCPDIASDDVYPELPGERDDADTVGFDPVTITDYNEPNGSQEGAERPEERDEKKIEKADGKEGERVEEQGKEEVVGEVTDEVSEGFPVVGQEEDKDGASKISEKKGDEAGSYTEAAEKYLQDEYPEGDEKTESDIVASTIEQRTERTEDEEIEDDGESVEAEETAYEEVEVDAIPGIGAVVPDEIVADVVGYFTKVSAGSQGTAMPRHVRHYSCPPLEASANGELTKEI